MTAVADFKSFWARICVDKALPLALRYFVATHWRVCHYHTQRNSHDPAQQHAQEPIHMHLIGAEDLCDADYPYDAMAIAWRAVRRRKCQHKVRKLRKGHAPKYKKEAHTHFQKMLRFQIQSTNL